MAAVHRRRVDVQAIHPPEKNLGTPLPGDCPRKLINLDQAESPLNLTHSPGILGKR